MKAAIFALIFLVSACLTFSGVAWAQTAIDAFGAKVIYAKPDEKVWTLVKETNPGEGSKGVQMFKHAKIMLYPWSLNRWWIQLMPWYIH
jgi:hypothetical protein